MKRAWCLLVIAFVAACNPASEPAATVTITPAPSDQTATLPAPVAEPPSTPPPTVPTIIGADDPLQAGLVRYEGMVLPTKGGLDVRGVVFSLEALHDTMGDDAPGYDALLGAKLRIVAELEASPRAEPRTGAPHIQRRSGPGWTSKRLVSAEVSAEPVTIEGTVGRSKGLFTVGAHMVSREDLSWALSGEDPVGKRVRLWGQPRTYRCPPQAQCLIEGSIPMFDVGRAELVQ